MLCVFEATFKLRLVSVPVLGELCSLSAVPDKILYCIWYLISLFFGCTVSQRSPATLIQKEAMRNNNLFEMLGVPVRMAQS